MALKSTIFKAALQIADIDHGYYADHALTLARHPSETDERMMVRVVALALHAHQLQRLCGGDGTLAFGAGLSDPDDPDVKTARNDDFALVEILWSVGRSVKVKKKLLADLMATLSGAGLDPENVMVCFKETTWENWAFAGGRLIHT